MPQFSGSFRITLTACLIHITQDDLANRVEDGLTLPGVEALVNLARLLSTFWA